MTFSRLIAACLPPMILLAITAGQNTPAPQITFNRDVAPIVFRTCAACHHPGGAGPFSLLSYADAKDMGGRSRLSRAPISCLRGCRSRVISNLPTTFASRTRRSRQSRNGSSKAQWKDPRPPCPRARIFRRLGAGKTRCRTDRTKAVYASRKRDRPVLEFHPACSNQSRPAG